MGLIDLKYNIFIIYLLNKESSFSLIVKYALDDVNIVIYLFCFNSNCCHSMSVNQVAVIIKFL